MLNVLQFANSEYLYIAVSKGDTILALKNYYPIETFSVDRIFSMRSNHYSKR